MAFRFRLSLENWQVAKISDEYYRLKEKKKLKGFAILAQPIITSNTMSVLFLTKPEFSKLNKVIKDIKKHD